MNTLYFDCFSGAAGDMLVGALLDAGVRLETLRAHLARLKLEEFSVDQQRSWQGGLAGTRFLVRRNPARSKHRGLPDILRILGRSGLPEPVKRRSSTMFRMLAAAEAKVHGCGVEKVNFHEVGAVDAIVDVVSFCALHFELGEPRVVCSPLRVGEGFVDTEHGKIPVPAMATMELLRDVPIEMSGIAAELVTPTGAVILKTVVEHFGRDLKMTPRAVGYGLGTRVREHPPNAVRVIFADTAAASRELVGVLECNVDDMTGEELGALLDLCLQQGALDMSLSPLLMKKSRPGHALTLLCRVGEEDRFRQLLLAESSTLGVRSSQVERHVLTRHESVRESSLGEVRVKVITRPGGRVESIPEFDELVRLSRASGKPIAEVRARLQQELRQQPPSSV